MYIIVSVSERYRHTDSQHLSMNLYYDVPLCQASSGVSVCVGGAHAAFLYFVLQNQKSSANAPNSAAN